MLVPPTKEPTVTLVVEPEVALVPMLMVWVLPLPTAEPIETVWLAVDWPRVMVPVPLALPMVMADGALTVPINMEPAVPVAVPTSSFSEPELLVEPVALPVCTSKSLEFVEPVLVAAVPTSPLDVSTLKILDPEAF